LHDKNIDPNTIDVIFITHEHIDHIQGLKVFLNKYTIDVYMTEGTYHNLGYEINQINLIKPDVVVSIHGVDIHILKTSHDASESIALLFEDGQQRVLHMTDTGYISKKNLDKIKDCDVYLIESNYDLQTLMQNERYPFKTRQRIMSDSGHLSNEQCADYLSELVSNRTHTVLYAHLSENNNNHQFVIDHNKDLAVKNKIILKKDETVVISFED
jgi:phosphoribosyl 1,2-cyclic phosphodiesterase